MQPEMRALTLWRPWDQAILYGGKPIENRSWKPWKAVIGQYIALHAGAKYDAEGAAWMREAGLYNPPTKAECSKGVIVGAARLVGYVHETSDSIADTFLHTALPITQLMPTKNLCARIRSDPWFFGPYGWVLDDILVLSKPISCRGAQGLWKVPDEIVVKMQEQIRESR